MPALHWRRGLKQRRKGFLVAAGANAEDTEGLSFFASSAERDLPHPDKAAITATFGSACADPCASQEVHVGGYAACRMGSGGMTARIREFLKKRCEGHASWSTSMSSARTI